VKSCSSHPYELRGASDNEIRFQQHHALVLNTSAFSKSGNLLFAESQTELNETVGVANSSRTAAVSMPFRDSQEKKITLSVATAGGKHLGQLKSQEMN